MWKSHSINNHLDVGNLPVEDSLFLKISSMLAATAVVHCPPLLSGKGIT
jgi:hypothetical protein